MIVWTKDALAELTPLRGECKPPKLDVDVAALQKAIAARMSVEGPKFEKGIKKKLGDVELAREVLAYCKQMKPDSPLDPRIQGAMLAMLRGWANDDHELVRKIVRHWIVAAGVVFTIRALHQFALRRVMHPKGKLSFDFEISSLELEPTGGWSLWGLRGHELRADLTRAIQASSDETYAEVVKTVGELRKKAPTSLRCDLSALVHTESAWAKEDIRALLAKKAHMELSTTTALFPALGRSKEAVQLLEAFRAIPVLLGTHVYDAVRALEDDAIAPLTEAMKAFEKDPPKANMGLAQARDLARALALFDDERAAAAFVPWVGDAKSLGPIAVEYMQRFPAHAVRTLAPRLLEKTKGAEPAQQLLARIARAHSAEVRAAAASLSESLRAAVEKLLGAGASETKKVAANETDVPALLRDPPWRRKDARPTLPVVEKLRAVAYEERVVFESEAERKSLVKPVWGVGSHKVDADKLRKQVSAFVEEGRRDSPSWSRPLIVWHSMSEAAGALALWNETPIWARRMLESSNFSEVACMLARFGVAAIPGAIASTNASMEPLAFAALMRCDSPRVAHTALRGAGRGAHRRAAVRWMEAHPVAAAIGLVPIALGPTTREKVDAANALRVHVDRKTLVEVTARFGDEASRALEAVLAFDPLFDCPKAAPKLSAYADPSTLPPVLLANGSALPEDARRNLLEMLQFTPLDPPYAGVAPVVAALDRASLDDILRVLVDAWVSSGASSASAWPLRAIAHAGSDAMARELAAKIRKWPREKGRPRALLGVDVLGAMGTDVALMHLFDLSKTAKNRHIEARATEVLVAAASARGLSGDALEDRLVPALELDPHGSTMLDFGARQFRVRVDEHLAPNVYEGDTRLPTLPRANKNDDVAKAKAASARFKTLKAELETLAKTQLWRLEHAMVARRTWDASEHRALLVDHPLVGRVARKLVWAVFDGDAIASTFRVAEDGTLASDQDKPVTLAPATRVGIPHPLLFDAAQKAQWSRVLGDYAIIQPFEQIARPTFAVDAVMRKKTSIDRFAKREIPYGVVFGRLESRGWRRGAMDEGSISTLEKDFGHASATLAFSPPLFAREKPPKEITIDEVTFNTPLGEVPAIAFSEAMLDLSVFDRST